MGYERRVVFWCVSFEYISGWIMRLVSVWMGVNEKVLLEWGFEVVENCGLVCWNGCFLYLLCINYFDFYVVVWCEVGDELFVVFLVVVSCNWVVFVFVFCVDFVGWYIFVD